MLIPITLTRLLKKKFLVIGLWVIFLILSPLSAIASQLEVEPSGSLTLKYNDNIFLKNEHKISDFIANLQLCLPFFYASEHFKTEEVIRLNGIKYQDNDELDSINQFYGGNFSYEVSPQIDFVLQGYYLNDTFAGLSSQEPEDTGFMLFQVGRERLVANPAISFKLTEQTALDASYGYRYNHYHESGWEDYQANNVFVGLKQQFKNEKTVGLLKTSYSYFDFKTGSSETYKFLAGVEHNIRPDFKIWVLIGPGYSKAEAINIADNQLYLLFDVSLTKNFEFWDIWLRAERELIGSAYGTPLIRNVGRMGLGCNFFEKLRILVTAEYYENKSTCKIKKVHYAAATINPGLSYNYRPDVSFELDYRFRMLNNKVYNTEAYGNEIFARCVLKSFF